MEIIMENFSYKTQKKEVEQEVNRWPDWMKPDCAKTDEKKFLVLYLWREDESPKFMWATQRQLNTIFDKKKGKYPERIIIEGGTVLSDTLTSN
jgi:hypothetical protein